MVFDNVYIISFRRIFVLELKRQGSCLTTEKARLVNNDNIFTFLTKKTTLSKKKNYKNNIQSNTSNENNSKPLKQSSIFDQILFASWSNSNYQCLFFL